MRTNDEKLMTAVESFMNTCIHFTGTQNKTCEKGIKYPNVKGLMRGNGIPCFRNCNMAGGECGQAEFMTLQEATAEYEDGIRRSKAIFDLECPDCGADLEDNRIQDGKHKGHGTISCPVCRKVKVVI